MSSHGFKNSNCLNHQKSFYCCFVNCTEILLRSHIWFVGSSVWKHLCEKERVKYTVKSTLIWLTLENHLQCIRHELKAHCTKICFVNAWWRTMCEGMLDISYKSLLDKLNACVVDAWCSICSLNVLCCHTMFAFRMLWKLEK